jgi:hypothetical protein
MGFTSRTGEVEKTTLLSRERYFVHVLEQGLTLTLKLCGAAGAVEGGQHVLSHTYDGNSNALQHNLALNHNDVLRSYHIYQKFRPYKTEYAILQQSWYVWPQKWQSASTPRVSIFNDGTPNL